MSAKPLFLAFQRSSSAYACLVVLTLAAVRCVPDIPEGRIACQTTSECPGGWSCREGLCYAAAQGFDAGADAGLLEVFADAAALDGSRDGSQDASVTRDSGTPLADSGPIDIGPPLVPADDCQRREPDHELGVVVSPAPAGSTANNCGSAARPCASIALGLARAALLARAFVYLDHGQYEEEVALPAGVTLLGGWDNVDARWTEHCGGAPEQLATIVSPTSVAVRAEYSGQSTLGRLTIRHRDSAPGESRYGVFARGPETRLTLRHVFVHAADGGDGETGAAGAMPAAPSESCALGDGAPAGEDGAKGESAGAGMFTADGFAAGHGQVGEPGLPGHAGAERTVSCATCVVDGSCAASGLALCAGEPTGATSCPTAGAPGCGGLPGPGGSGGPGGGASVALFIWQAHVEVYESLLRAGDGGAGALGAAGGLGGPASEPGVGAPGETCVRCTRSKIIGPVLPGPKPGAALCTQTISGAAAVSGNAGTPGSAGGAGGDGAGGSSYAVFRGGGAELRSDNVRLEHGEPGSSLGAGAMGAAAPESEAQ